MALPLLSKLGWQGEFSYDQAEVAELRDELDRECIPQPAPNAAACL